MRDLVSKGTEKWTVGGMGNSSFRVVPLKAEQQNCLEIIKNVFKEGRADAGNLVGESSAHSDEEV